MKLFLDASVLLAACGRPSGGSWTVCDLAARQGWKLLASHYVVREVEKNLLLRFPLAAQNEWQRIKPLLDVMADVTTFAWPVVFPAAKDRPVLFTAAAVADVLLTLDRYPVYHHDMFQTGYGSAACPPSGIPDPEFSAYHRQVFEFLRLKPRYRR